MASSSGVRRRAVASTTAAALTALLLGLTGIAAASQPTAAISTGARAIPSGGGAAAPGVPTIRDVVCDNGCVGLRKATVGGLVQISGRNLVAVTKVTFAAADGRVAGAVVDSTDSTAEVRVPSGAITGKVRAKDDFGNSSNLSPTELEVHPRSALQGVGQLALVEAEATPSKAYIFGVHSPRLRYVIASDQRLNDLRIDVVSSSGEIIKSFFRQGVEANTTQSVRWNGKTTAGGPAANGSYWFRISSESGQRATQSSGREGASLAFKLFGFIFPIRGAHSYGDGIGAPRSGHTHQGQDVFARCGTRLVAARGGRVQYAGYHSSAGNYIVIDGRATGIDFVYMHMVSPSPFRAGQMVRTGQAIGQVGETGNASGCHLHYEMWGPPGWYEGGHFLDPTPSLKRWDRYS